jgi:DNA-binding NtrC family response regulator
VVIAKNVLPGKNLIAAQKTASFSALPFEAVFRLDLAMAVLGFQKTILMVESDEQVRDVCSAMLKSAGYDVLPARSCEEALRIEKSVGNAIDAVVCDCNLPDTDGVRTALQLSRLRPSVPCLLISAGSDEMIPPRFAFLGKPFAPDQLRHTIAQMLEIPVSPVH